MNKIFIYILFFLATTVTFGQQNPVLQETTDNYEFKGWPIDSVYEQTRKVFVLNNQNKISEAIELSEKLLKYEEYNKNDSLRAQVFNVMAISYIILKDTTLAFKYFGKARSLFKSLNNINSVIMIDNNVGVSYRQANAMQKSTQKFKNVLALARQTNNTEKLALAHFNLAKNTLKSERNLFNALVDLDQATIFNNKIETTTSKFLKADILKAYADVYKKLKENNIALNYYDKAILQAKKDKYFEAIDNLYKDKASLLTDLNKHNDAKKELENRLFIIDSLSKSNEKKVFLKKTTNKKSAVSLETLKLAESQKQLQVKTLKKIEIFNILLIILSAGLLFFGYWIYTKNRELKVAKNLADKIAKMRSEFYSEISHELRTPLYAIIQLSNILLKEKSDVNHLQYLQSLKYSGNHLMLLINNVLELNKIESGMKDTQEHEFNLKLLVNDIVDALDYGFKENNNNLKLIYDSNIPKAVIGDGLKLNQILVNLISNANKYTSNGEIKLVVKQQSVSATDVLINFTVKDTGIGISKENQQLIFENFYQDNTNYEKSYKGTGLGLSIVKHMLNTMGTDIQLESAEQQGAEFSFALRLQRQNNKSAAALQSYQDQLNSIANTLVLVVDDNKINRVVTQKVLSQFNAKAVLVSSGERAIEEVKNKDFDCILMDLNMPGIDGYETSKQIRMFNESVPILALTAATTKDIEIEIYNSKMNGFILKPFSNSDFVSRLSRAIKHKQEAV